jgi:hypothetical protein
MPGFQTAALKRDEQFAAELHYEITSGASGQVDSWMSADLSKVRTEQGRALIKFVQSLSDGQRQVLQELVTQSWIDGAAVLCAAIQGTFLLSSFDEELRLTHGVEDVGRDLLTNFLTADERARPWVLG